MHKKGFTLLEIILSISLFMILMVGTILFFRTYTISWVDQESRIGSEIVVRRGINEVARDLKDAMSINSITNYNEIRFSEDNTNFFIYYLYNQSDTYLPPPSFKNSTYQLKRTALTGGINGSFVYGEGKIILNDVSPPPATNLSISNNIVNIDLSILNSKGHTINYQTKIKPRNI